MSASEEEFKMLDEALKASMDAAFGENRFFIAYGKGKYNGKETGLIVDNVAKDMLMVAMQPVGNAITGVMMTALGFLRLAISILSLGTLDNAATSMAMTLTGVGITALTIIMPITRIFNLLCRCIKSLDAPDQNPSLVNVPSPESLVAAGSDIANGNQSSLKILESKVQSCIERITNDARITPIVSTVRRGLFMENNKSNGESTASHINNQKKS